MTLTMYHFFICEYLQQTVKGSTERLTRGKETLWRGMCDATVKEHVSSVPELKGGYLGGAVSSEVPVVVQEVFWIDDEVSL